MSEIQGNPGTGDELPTHEPIEPIGVDETESTTNTTWQQYPANDFERYEDWLVAREEAIEENRRSGRLPLKRF